MTNFVRFQNNGDSSFGVLEEETISEISNAPFSSYQTTGKTFSLGDVKLLSPVSPNKIVAIGLNYKSHLGGRPGPAAPEPFLKASTTVVGPGDNIVIPKIAIDEGVKIQPEAELALVIGKECKGATQANALDYVFAYTCGNDVS
ncbi:MAG TPA: fumarylacetoacetate hydrolase, partial [Dehalococcoidia bacterium]|nr:fumarylacetoacetate hydrolase [Dehalococcoidia bacterium]